MEQLSLIFWLTEQFQCYGLATAPFHVNVGFDKKLIPPSAFDLIYQMLHAMFYQRYAKRGFKNNKLI